MKAEIGLLVEGTYPYISGGVSSWVHDLITHLPEYTFTIIHLSARVDPGRTVSYRLPENVVGFCEIPLHDLRWMQRSRASHTSEATWQHLRAFHQALALGKPYDSTALFRHLNKGDRGNPTTRDLFYSLDSWNLLAERYMERAPASSLVDFFWTFRFTHLPLFALFEAALPEAQIYHAISAGYNAFLGALAKTQTGAPFLLTEHGIYVREREIEIAQAEWIYSEPHRQRLKHYFSFFQEWWLRTFRFMTKYAYDLADEIISITTANQHYQLEYGADPQKLRVIPNGIDTNRLDSLSPSAPEQSDGFVVGFVGRVVPIKDLKTFIHTVKIASSVIPHLTAYIVGPTDEDPGYLAECQQLVEFLGLSAIIHFTGQADVLQYYRQIDVLVLTSLSEAQPLVILEANGAGIPVVAPDVGACRELLTGKSPEDKALGPSGLLTPTVSPDKTADALVFLWREREVAQRMGRTGKERVHRFYRQELLYDAYRTLYRSYLTSSPQATER